MIQRVSAARSTSRPNSGTIATPMTVITAAASAIRTMIHRAVFT